MKEKIKRKIKIKWKVPAKWTIFGLTLGVVIATVGSVAALNGWFGGGGSIPEDTMTRGLVGYWGFDEGSGAVAYDASNYGNNGSLTSASWAKGKVGGALSFDGVDDYVDAGNDASLDITGAITVEAWAKSNSSTRQMILGKYYSGTDGEWYIDINDSVGATFNYVLSPASRKSLNVGSTGAYSNGVWHHFVGTFGSEGGKFYIDGVQVKSDSTTGALIDTDDKLFIGQETAGIFFNGLIDEVRIYNRALSAEEVRYHYNRGGPVAQWKMDEGEGRTVYDSTDNNNDGTLVLAGSATSSAWVTGKYGTALSFDGTDDYIEATVSQTKTSYSLWIKPTGSVWEHIARIDGVDYVNGVLGTPSAFPIHVDGNTVQIGKTGASAYFNGLIDEVRIYNYARTAEQIRQDYNAGLSAHFK